MVAKTGRSDRRGEAEEQKYDVVSRMLSALEYIAAADGPITASDMASDLHIPRATAYRICARLEQERILIPDLSGRGYSAGKRLSDMSITVLVNSTAHGARHRVLQRLVDQLGETCNLTTLIGSEIVYVDRVETDWPLRMHLNPGSRVPIHCTATGKLLLSLLPERRRQELITAAPLRRYTEATITDPLQLTEVLDSTRSEMVGVDDEEFVAGMVAVAVPVLNQAGEACAALAVHGPKVRLTQELAREHVPALRGAASQLSRLL